MRIHVKQLFNNKEIFGALCFDITGFSGFFTKDGQTMAMFDTKKHGSVYCDKTMLSRIVERLKATGFDYKIAENTLLNFK